MNQQTQIVGDFINAAKEDFFLSVEDEFRIPEQVQDLRLASLVAKAKTLINIEPFPGFSVTISTPMQRTFKHRIYPMFTNASRRRNFAHQESRKLVNQYGIIVFEKLNIRGMLKNHCLAKSIAAAAWRQLVEYTTYKAENAGQCARQVNAPNSGQMCNGCGDLVRKELSVRIHKCSGCGLVIDRDRNAALNILSLGLQTLGIESIEAPCLS